jgi:hypothetical protein
MKKTFNKTVKQEIEFDTPCYIKYGENHFTKIVDEKTSVIIDTYNFSTRIAVETTNLDTAFGNNGWEFTTRELFEEAFDKAFKKVSELPEFHNL